MSTCRTKTYVPTLFLVPLRNLPLMMLTGPTLDFDLERREEAVMVFVTHERKMNESHEARGFAEKHGL